MLTTLLSLIAAALLEVGGDAAIRYGLLRSATAAMVAGAVALVAYGFVVNTNRLIEFNRLMGVYIAVIYLVSQMIGVAVFGERPTLPAIAGGALIVTGGLLIQLTAG
jgi:small multidrug resistance family-3 protein